MKIAVFRLQFDNTKLRTLWNTSPADSSTMIALNPNEISIVNSFAKFAGQSVCLNQSWRNFIKPAHRKIMKIKYLLSFASICCITGVCLAEDITTLDGQTYKNIRDVTWKHIFRNRTSSVR
jgi:hypothetical protein